jgi:uncharacterized protein (TIGR03437 family)
MKEPMRSYAKILLCLAASIPADAQVISAVAGTGIPGYNGDGGAAVNAWISMPTGIAFDTAGNLYFADNGNRVVRQVNTSGIINTFAGNFQLFFGNNGDGGPATNAILGFQSSVYYGLAADKSGNLYISDTSNGIARVRKVNSSGIISTYAGGASPISGGDGGPATSAGLMTAAGLAVDSQGNLYIADTVGERIRKVNTAGIISTVAGTGVANYSGDGGPAVNATLSVPVGIAVDAQGNLYITEKGNALYGPRIRKVDTSGNISTMAGNGKLGFAGDGGSALNAEFGINLQGIAVDNAGNIYIADYGNDRIRKVDTSGTITTIAGNDKPGGSGTNGNGGLASNSLVQPTGLAVDPSGNLYISDYSSSQIRKIAFGASAPGLSVSAGSLYFAGRSGPLFTIPPQSLSTSTTGPPISYTASAATTSGGAWMSLNGNPSISGTTPGTINVSINTTPGGATLAAGTYQGTITFTSTTPGYNKPVTVAVTMVISTTVPSPAPVITGVVNGASLQANQSFAANTYVTIHGTNLSSTTSTWNNSIVGGQLPTSLNGVTVTFSGVPGYISYVSSTQINVLAPPMAGGAGPLQVNNNGAVSTPMTVGVAPVSPAFFELSGNQLIATRLDYTYAAANGTITGLATTPAKPGDVLILWGTGFGVTNPTTPAGWVTPSGQTYSAIDPVTVTINGVQATVYGVALTPGLAGIYQVAIQVPPTLANGNWQLVATTQDGFSSATGVILTVHN